MAKREPLREGDTGPRVAHLQKWLNATFPLYSDIDLGPQRYGPQTVAVIAEFQRRAGVTGPDADGTIVGPRTWAALEAHGYVHPDDETIVITPDGEDWSKRSRDERMRYVVKRLVDVYGYPVNGAAGVVGNLSSESWVIPNCVEGSSEENPMTAPDFGDEKKKFTPDEVMNRVKGESGPREPGVGLAQWTWPRERRARLFIHVYEGRSGSGVLFDMDAQIDYLNWELRQSYNDLCGVILNASVSVNDASDEFVYDFERPGAILGDNGRLPRDHREVQKVFAKRREQSMRALQAYRG